ncbi:MAG TPA: hypothetical protein VFL79_02020 [Terriglobia bacterium]|nr:hypothetical protein [Terriglobia bacterium]
MKVIIHSVLNLLHAPDAVPHCIALFGREPGHQLLMFLLHGLEPLAYLIALLPRLIRVKLRSLGIASHLACLRTELVCCLIACAKVVSLLACGPDSITILLPRCLCCR